MGKNKQKTTKIGHFGVKTTEIWAHLTEITVDIGNLTGIYVKIVIFRVKPHVKDRKIGGQRIIMDKYINIGRIKTNIIKNIQDLSSCLF